MVAPISKRTRPSSICMCPGSAMVRSLDRLVSARRAIVPASRVPTVARATTRPANVSAAGSPRQAALVSPPVFRLETPVEDPIRPSSPHPAGATRPRTSRSTCAGSGGRQSADCRLERAARRDTGCRSGRPRCRGDEGAVAGHRSSGQERLGRSSRGGPAPGTGRSAASAEGVSSPACALDRDHVALPRWKSCSGGGPGTTRVASPDAGDEYALGAAGAAE